MRSATIAGIGKGIGYMAFALNQILNLTKNATSYVYTRVTNKDIYTVEIMVEGVVIKTTNNQSAAQVSRLLKTMDNFGITNVTITRQAKN